MRMFLALGLRPGEMFALRWNDKEGDSLRIDSSITEAMESKPSRTELEFLRSATKGASFGAFIFPSSRGAAISTNKFLFRVFKEAASRPASTA